MNLSRSNANWRQWENQRRKRGKYQNFQGQATNTDQPCSINNAYFNCGKVGHFTRNCPNKRQRQINLINMDEDTMYEETSLSEDHLSCIHANLVTLSIDEKEQLAKKMRIAPTKDFHTAWSDWHWLGKITIAIYTYWLKSLVYYPFYCKKSQSHHSSGFRGHRKLYKPHICQMVTTVHQKKWAPLKNPLTWMGWKTRAENSNTT